jgi:hypothetical protein
VTGKGTKDVIGRGEYWTAHPPALGPDAVGLEEFESKTGVSQLTGELAARVRVVVAGVRAVCGDLAGCGPVFLAGQRGSAGGVLPYLGDKGLDGREGEVRAVAEDGVTRPGKSHQAGGAVRQLAG